MVAFYNLGSTCYLNAVASILVELMWVTEQIKTLITIPPFSHLITDVTKSSGKVIALTQTAGWFKRKLGLGAQCTLECMNYFLAGIDDSKTLRSAINTRVEQAVSCAVCGETTTTTEEHPMLLVDYDATDVVPPATTITNYECASCNGPTSATQTLSYKHPGDQQVLVCAIKRPNGAAAVQLPVQSMFPGFQLKGFTINTGGHHVSVVRAADDDVWKLCNDESVRDIEVAGYLPRAHVLAYERIN